MVYLYLCESCKKGDHKNCTKGHPAPEGVYGGSKCKCFDLAHKYTPEHFEKKPKYNIEIGWFEKNIDKDENLEIGAGIFQFEELEK